MTVPPNPASATTDEVLLKEFLAGDRSALGRLAARYERALLGLAKGLLGGREDLACDVVQETWVRVIRFGSSFGGRSSFKTWIYRIVVNQCSNIRAANFGGAKEGNAGGELAKATMGVIADPSATASVAERNGTLRAAVDALGDDKRSVLLVCYHAGLTHEDAAEVLQIPLGTLKSRLNSALTELRKTLNAEATHDR